MILQRSKKTKKTRKIRLTVILTIFLAALAVNSATATPGTQQPKNPMPDTSKLTIDQKIQLIEKLQKEVKAAQASAINQGQPSVQQGSPQPAVTTPKVTQDHYKPGWIVTVFKANDKIETIPNDSLGQFITSDMPYTLKAHRKNQGMKWYKGQAWYLYEGFFHAKKKGAYTFIAQIILPPMTKSKSTYWDKNRHYVKCAYYLEIEGNSVIKGEPLIASDRTPTEGTMIGTAQLEEGVYKVRQWFACQGQRPNNEFTRAGLDIDPTDEVQIYFKIKEPNSQIPRAVTPVDFVHKVAQ